MDIEAVKLKQYFKKSDSTYLNIVVASLRARQIIDDRFEKLVIEEDIEDSDQLDTLINDMDFDEPKAISMAMDEFMDEQLEWRKTDSEEENIDEK